jgi:hypothetical protein
MTATSEARLAAARRPDRSPVMHQSWRNLLFLHWRWNAEDIQVSLPPGLHVDLFDGSAWLGVVPFFMRCVRPRGLPAVPAISNFLELNVRTYVVDERGVPGVWFYSLDCNQPLAVAIARTCFHLPYRHARMKASEKDGSFTYSSTLRSGGDPTIFQWTGQGVPDLSGIGTLEGFLIERYVLFAHDPLHDRLWEGHVAHAPYLIRPAVGTSNVDELLAAGGFDPEGRGPDHVVESPGVDVDIFNLQRLR